MLFLFTDVTFIISVFVTQVTYIERWEQWDGTWPVPVCWWRCTGGVCLGWCYRCVWWECVWTEWRCSRTELWSTGIQIRADQPYRCSSTVPFLLPEQTRSEPEWWHLWVELWRHIRSLKYVLTFIHSPRHQFRDAIESSWAIKEQTLSISLRAHWSFVFVF